MNIFAAMACKLWQPPFYMHPDDWENLPISRRLFEYEKPMIREMFDDEKATIVRTIYNPTRSFYQGKILSDETVEKGTIKASNGKILVLSEVGMSVTHLLRLAILHEADYNRWK